MSISAKDANNIVWHSATVTRKRREALNGHRGAGIWFTGLSGSGKSTLAHTIEERLHQMGCRTFVFDGDNVRHGLCMDLGFSQEDRKENLRRIGEMIKLYIETGIVALTAFISPMKKDREAIRKLIGDQDFLEIYCNCPLAVCEQRDVKGLYKRARAGEIREFTGISAPYEPPENADLVLNTGESSLNECAESVIRLLNDRGIIEHTIDKT